MKTLSAEFYRRDTETVAKELLGKRIEHVVDGVTLSARITETEAYLGPEDKACHSYGWKRTSRTEVMYRPGGVAYVYLIYGMHHMLNAVTEQEGMPCAVLIRAAEPVDDKRCGLLNGPGKLCRGMSIDKRQNGVDLTAGSLYICEDTLPYPFKIQTAKRVGIPYAEEAIDWPLRFIATKTG